jgi:hypothetical protein
MPTFRVPSEEDEIYTDLFKKSRHYHQFVNACWSISRTHSLLFNLFEFAFCFNILATPDMTLC